MSKEMTSNKPYIVRAYYEWISDNQLTPYILVDVSVYGVMVPMSYVNDGQIILNVSYGAVGAITLENAIEFSARFGGKLEHIVVPFGAVAAIYAKENGAGTSLAIEHVSGAEEIQVKDSKPAKAQPILSQVTSSPLKGVVSRASSEKEEQASSEKPSNEKSKKKSKPSLKIIK